MWRGKSAFLQQQMFCMKSIVDRRFQRVFHIWIFLFKFENLVFFIAVAFFLNEKKKKHSFLVFHANYGGEVRFFFRFNNDQIVILYKYNPNNK